MHFRRIKECRKTAHDVVQESKFPSVPIDEDTGMLLKMWLVWARHLANEELPQNFLPLYGFEGRTQSEVRREESKGEDVDDDFAGLGPDKPHARAASHQPVRPWPRGSPRRRARPRRQ